MKIRLSYQQWAVTALLFAAAGCSSDDITTEKTAKPAAEENETEQTGFVAGTEGTRTSLDYDTRDFFWEEKATESMCKTTATSSSTAAMP